MNAGATQAPPAPPALPAVAAWRPLKALLGGGFGVPDDFEVADLTLDSRSVRPGAAFLACRGRT
ncbi:MAG: hypothetical protein KGL25_05130, partial [Gammaproteobacteria bacterium]|nr:hypothetical protein [Gammaproteobacteria bacterium]